VQDWNGLHGWNGNRESESSNVRSTRYDEVETTLDKTLVSPTRRLEADIEMSDNGNGNGQQNRVRAQSIDTSDTVSYCFAIAPNGGLLLPDRHEVEQEAGERVWTTTWEDLPTDTVVLRVVKFREASGFWTPLELPETQTDEQVLAVEKLLRLHGVAFVAELGLEKKWSKGARKR
jgi:hypothetical protein